MNENRRFDLVLYTIGHSNLDVGHFSDLLVEHGVTQLADVRSVPYSKFMTDFGKDALSAYLRGHGFTYAWVGDRLGGKRESQMNSAGLRNDDAVFSDPDFRAGLVDLMRMALRKPTAIMCSEEDPSKCHRHKLIATALLRKAVPECHKLDSITVLHIRSDGTVDDASRMEVAVQGVLAM